MTKSFTFPHQPVAESSMLELNEAFSIGNSVTFVLCLIQVHGGFIN